MTKHSKRHKFLASSLTATMVAAAVAPTAGFAAEQTKEFPDVPSDHWAADAIYYLVASGAINGFPDGTYGPSKSITRAAVAKVIAESLKDIELVDGATPTFPDVSADHYAAKHIAALEKAGIIDGTDKGLFNPSGTLTRQAAAKIIVEAYGLELDENADVSFPDNNSWGADYINILASLGILEGTSEGLANPTGNLSRAALAILVHRAEVEDVRVKVPKIVLEIVDVRAIDITTIEVTFEGVENPVIIELDEALMHGDNEVTFEYNDVEYTETVNYVDPAVVALEEATEAVEAYEAGVDSVEKVEELVSDSEKYQEVAASFTPAFNAVQKVTGDEKTTLLERLNTAQNVVIAAGAVSSLQNATVEITEDNLDDAKNALRNANNLVHWVADEDIKTALMDLVDVERAKVDAFEAELDAQEAALEAVVAYEEAPITTPEEVASAEELEGVAVAKVEKVTDEDVKAELGARIDAKRAVVEAAKEEFGDIELAETKIAKLQEALEKDLTVEENLVAAETLLLKAQEALEKVDTEAVLAELTPIVEAAEVTLTDARNAFTLQTSINAINDAPTSLAVLEILLNEEHAEVLGLDTGEGSKFAELSDSRQLNVARNVNSVEDYEKVEDIVEAFDNAVDAQLVSQGIAILNTAIANFKHEAAEGTEEEKNAEENAKKEEARASIKGLIENVLYQDVFNLDGELVEDYYELEDRYVETVLNSILEAEYSGATDDNAEAVILKVTFESAVEEQLDAQTTAQNIFDAVTAVNEATLFSMQQVLENEVYADVLGLDVDELSDYASLSEEGKVQVASVIFNKKSDKKYETDASGKATLAGDFAKAASDQVGVEVGTELSAVNEKDNTTDLKTIIEDEDTSAKLGIETGEGSAYDALDEANKEVVLQALLEGKNEYGKKLEQTEGTAGIMAFATASEPEKVYTNAAQVRKAFNDAVEAQTPIYNAVKAVNDVKVIEDDLETALSEMKAILEVHAPTLKIELGEDTQFDYLTDDQKATVLEALIGQNFDTTIIDDVQQAFVDAIDEELATIVNDVNDAEEDDILTVIEQNARTLGLNVSEESVYASLGKDYKQALAEALVGENFEKASEIKAAFESGVALQKALEDVNEAESIKEVRDALEDETNAKALGIDVHPEEEGKEASAYDGLGDSYKDALAKAIFELDDEETTKDKSKLVAFFNDQVDLQTALQAINVADDFEGVKELLETQEHIEALNIATTDYNNLGEELDYQNDVAVAVYTAIGEGFASAEAVVEVYNDAVAVQTARKAVNDAIAEIDVVAELSNFESLVGVLENNAEVLGLKVDEESAYHKLSDSKYKQTVAKAVFDAKGTLVKGVEGDSETGEGAITEVKGFSSETLTNLKEAFDKEVVIQTAVKAVNDAPNATAMQEVLENADYAELLGYDLDAYHSITSNTAKFDVARLVLDEKPFEISFAQEDSDGDTATEEISAADKIKNFFNKVVDEKLVLQGVNSASTLKSLVEKLDDADYQEKLESISIEDNGDEVVRFNVEDYNKLTKEYRTKVAEALYGENRPVGGFQSLATLLEDFNTAVKNQLKAQNKEDAMAVGMAEINAANTTSEMVAAIIEHGVGIGLDKVDTGETTGGNGNGDPVLKDYVEEYKNFGIDAKNRVANILLDARPDGGYVATYDTEGVLVKTAAENFIDDYVKILEDIIDVDEALLAGAKERAAVAKDQAEKAIEDYNEVKENEDSEYNNVINTLDKLDTAIEGDEIENIITHTEALLTNLENLTVKTESLKYEKEVTIDGTVAEGTNVYDQVLVLIDGIEASDDIDITFTVTPSGDYLKVIEDENEEDVLVLKAQNLTLDNVTETVEVTFTKGDVSKTLQVTVTIEVQEDVAKALTAVGDAEALVKSDSKEDPFHEDKLDQDAVDAAQAAYDTAQTLVDGLDEAVVEKGSLQSRLGKVKVAIDEAQLKLEIAEDDENPTINTAEAMLVDGAIVLTVKASDNVGLAELEVDHSLGKHSGTPKEALLPEFSVPTASLTGEKLAKLVDIDTEKYPDVNVRDASVKYDGKTQTWTINFGVALTDVIKTKLGIKGTNTLKFYLVVKDLAGNQSGSMYDGSYETITIEIVTN